MNTAVASLTLIAYLLSAALVSDSLILRSTRTEHEYQRKDQFSDLFTNTKNLLSNEYTTRLSDPHNTGSVSAGAAFGNMLKMRSARDTHIYSSTDIEGVDHVPYSLDDRKDYQIFDTTITCAVTEYASIYLNGKFVGKIDDWRSFGTFQVYTGPGDVIGVMAMNTKGWHGLIMDISFGDYHYMTGHDGFKACAAEHEPNKELWKMPTETRCNWKKPVVALRPDDDRFSKSYPYRPGAKYVWAVESAPVGHIFLRYVIGGEKCDHPTPSPSPTQWNKIEGTKECMCREVVGPPGDCFEFSNPNSYNYFHTKKRCMRRDCAPRFECVEEGQSSVTICIRRFAYTEVILIKTFPIQKCVQIKNIPPKVYYSPYS